MDDRRHLAEMRDPASAGYDHSTLEVAPGLESLDHGKEVVPGLGSLDHGKEVDPGFGSLDHGKEVVPGLESLDHDQKVVQQPNVPVLGVHNHYSPQTPILQPGTIWEGGAGAGADAGASTPKEARILGLRRKTFFIVVGVVSLIVAIAVGVGAGLGVTMRSRSGTGTTEGAATGVPGFSASASTSARDRDTAVLTTSTPTQTPSSAPSTAASLTQSTAPAAVGEAGGRCSNEWGGDCICLDEGICRNRWQGTPYTGTPGNWPCPNDPDNIMACVIQPCLGQVAPAQCLWREACRELNPGTGSAPICPGGNDFVCCAHAW